jgi:ubiquinone biosynthesis protein UbiJ
VRDKLTCFAVAFYGPHVSGADLASDEHTMLASLASDAALAYAHAETDALRRQVAALERRLHELRG